MLVVMPGRGIFLLSFVVPFFLFISNTYPSSRYLNPILPLLALWAGWALSTLATRLRLRPWLFWVAVAACATPGLASSLQAGLFFRQTDTRTLALEFVEREVPDGATVLVQPYSVPLRPSHEGLLEALAANLGSPDKASIKFQLQLAQSPYPTPAYRLYYLGRGGLDAEKLYVDPAELGGETPLAPLRRLGVAFVILKGYNTEDSELSPLRTALVREGRRLAAFSPYRDGAPAQAEPFLHNTDARIDGTLARPGPVLEIWQLDDTGS